MPLHIIRQDIVRMQVDAIVSADGPQLRGGGGVSARIHQAAGPEMAQACRKLGGCPPGEARLTKGFALPSRYVIHTVGPVWQGGSKGERELLHRCYTASLTLAAGRRMQAVAFPLIASGTYGFPREQALQIAVGAIRTFLAQHEMTVYLVVYDQEAFCVSSTLYDRVTQYIDEHYVQERMDAYGRRREQLMQLERAHWLDAIEKAPSCAASAPADIPQRVKKSPAPKALPDVPETPGELQRLLGRLDEGFSARLLRLIDERGMKDSDCYKRANIDRKHFSKIRSNPAYQPSKTTALAFAVALRLNRQETGDLLEAAGYALSNASMADVIVTYFIDSGHYDVDAINQLLFAYALPTLGC